MFLKEIKVVETTPCLAEKHLFKGITRASVSLTEILPYLNAIVDKPDYQPNSNSLMFKDGIIGFTLQEVIPANSWIFKVKSYQEQTPSLL